MSIGRKLGNKQDIFDKWADKVGLLTGIRQLDDEKYRNTPEVCALETLLSEAKVAPKWLADLDSPFYLPYRSGVFQRVTSVLVHTVTRLGLTLSDKDPTLDVEVAQCLPNLLAVCLSGSGSHNGSTEADRRCHMNALLSCLFDLQGSSKMFQGNEHPLRLPEPVSAAGVIPDSSVFFTIDPILFAGLRERIAQGCMVVHPSSSFPSGKVLHSVTEYKRKLGLTESRQQVQEGLTSALYQRRALGFMDHFVFGTSHYNRTSLEVVAATWVSADEEAPPDRTMEIDNAPGRKTEGDEAKLVGDSKRRNKIAIYSLGIFSMGDVGSMLSFYLLMRSTRELAMKYRDDITASSTTRSNCIFDANAKLFDWYNPPEPTRALRVGPKSTSSVLSQPNNHPVQFDSDNWNTYAVMDELDYDYYSTRSDNESDSTLPSNSAIDETNWNELREKVHAFLASTLLVGSEEANDTATCEDNSGEGTFQGETQMI